MSSPGDFSLAGRTAVVTGARSGIGRAIAVGYADAGAHVIAWGRTEAVTEAVEAIWDQGGSAEAAVADLSDTDATAGLAEELAATRSVDILVNNAGIITRAPAEELDDEQWRSVLTVNLDAVWLLSRVFGTAMLERGAGRIITIASMLSFQGARNVAAYTASKHAVVGLTGAGHRVGGPGRGRERAGARVRGHVQHRRAAGRRGPCGGDLGPDPRRAVGAPAGRGRSGDLPRQ